MSSTPHSPPETPLKPTMALENETLTPKIRSSDTPSKLEPKLSAPESKSKAVKQSESQAAPEVQVPSAVPRHEEENGSVEKEVPYVEQMRSEPPENPTEAMEDDHEIAEAQPDSNAELPEMDWNKFQLRYREAIAKADEEEDRLLEEFEKYFEVIQPLCYSI